MTGRSVKEWVGRTPDAKVPPRVRDRIFEAHGHMCHLTRRKILPTEAWDLDHIRALCNGGEHRESNLAPALVDRHRAKTREDVREKSEIATIRKKHNGIKQSRNPIPGSRCTAWKRKLDGTTVRRDP